MKHELKIGILSLSSIRDKPDLEDRMLQKSAQYLGHKARVYISKFFQFTFDSSGPSLLYKSKRFIPPDVMIIRPYVLTDIDLKLSIVKQLQLMNIPTVNHYLPIVRAKNKVRTLQILNHHGLPLPKTVIVHSLDFMDQALDQIGKFPVILKMAQGSLGNGVSIIESKRSLKSMLDTLPKSIYLIQEYVKEAKGKDIRIFVVGGKVVAAMERKAKRGDFRSNFNQGGSVSTVVLSDEEINLALKATALIGLDVSGVDIIRTADGPKILEVNSNPGLEGITMATNVNVAQHIVSFAEKVVREKRWKKSRKNLVVAA